MKTISKLKLTQLSKADLEARQMNVLRGGNDDDTCRCGCAYMDEGGSSIMANSGANVTYGYGNTGGEPLVCSKPDPHGSGGYVPGDTRG